MNHCSTCDTPSCNARTTDFISHLWPLHEVSRFPTITAMPLTLASETISRVPDLLIDAGTPPSACAPAVSNDPDHNAAISSTEKNTARGHGHQTRMPLTPYSGTAPQLSGTYARTHRPGYVAASLVRAALPLLLHNDAIGSMPSTTVAPNPLASTLARDSLLIYAHRIYNLHSHPGASGISPHNPMSVTSPDHPYSSLLLPLLQKLRSLHPRHLPTLLLLGCVHYSVGNCKESIEINTEILQINANFVEAMSNTATALKSMGQIDDAIQWWWKAIHIRPDFWDAVDNLLGTLVTQEQSRSTTTTQSRPTYSEALRLCETVQSHLVDGHGEFLVSIRPQDLHRLQEIFYVSGSIRCVSGRATCDGLRDLVSSIETLLHMKPPVAAIRYSFKHFLMAGAVSGLIVGSRLSDPIIQLASSMGYSDLSSTFEDSSCSLLQFVKQAEEELWQIIMVDGDGTFPASFLRPEQALDLSKIMFRESLEVFPSLCSWSEAEQRLEKPTEDVVRKSRETASNVLLSIANLLQETGLATTRLPGFGEWVHVGPSLMLLLYYLAYSIFPSPSSCNNLGIVLSTTPWTDSRASDSVRLARIFYEKGLEMDPGHAHLLTNLGSLLKDAGDLDDAIEMYRRSVEANPVFDVALANLANALKDSGRLPESIEFYRRAVEANDDLPEAVCGLAHAAWSICDWRGLGRIDPSIAIDAEGNMLNENPSKDTERGWMPKLITMTQRQLSAAYHQNIGLVKSTGSIDDWISWIEEGIGFRLPSRQRDRWVSYLIPFCERGETDRSNINEGSFMLRIVEWLTRHLQWRWYTNAFGDTNFVRTEHAMIDSRAISRSGQTYSRPQLPSSMSIQLIPSVLPFHTFIYPLSARDIRLVAHRNAARVSHLTLTRHWLPEYVYPPPPPPCPCINVGYVSSDFLDHPTAHLMSSVFSMHDEARFSIFAYALTESDGSTYRHRIEQGADTFRDVSSWSTEAIVQQIIRDGIHILVNLNGYTKGARNDIFAARPCPVQISLLGFAGTLASCWCDYLVCDPIACPPATRACEHCDAQKFESHSATSDSPGSTNLDLGPDPDSMADWKYLERLIYMPHTYLVTDHKQHYGNRSRGLNGTTMGPMEQWRNAQEERRKLRRKLFPDIFEDTIILANFNQMYKLDPSIFATWLRILKRVPNSILWLLRFPPAGEEHLLRTASQWAGSCASRVRFTDVVSKDEHISRAAVADIFLDTVECNAHTVAADVLWGGTPIITWPKYTFKMCSRVGASIAFATGFGHQMVVDSLAAYEERAVSLALSVTPTSFRTGRSVEKSGELADLRRDLFLNREVMPLFDCQRWTRNLEKGYVEAWKRWVRGGTTTHYNNIEGGSGHQYESCNGFIWIRDGDT